MNIFFRMPRQSCRLGGQPRYTSLLLCLLCAALMLLLKPAAAILFEPIQRAPQTGSIDAWSASVQAIKALEAAIDDEEVHRHVRDALENTKTGFLPCSHNMYRCDEKGNIAEVVIDDLTNGRVDWTKFPKTVRRIYVRHSSLAQSLVLTSLPRHLVEFTAVDTQWKPSSLLVYPFDARRGNAAAAGPPPLPPSLCEDGAVRSECTYALTTLRCEGCGLTSANLDGTATLFPALTALNLNNNPQLTFDVRAVPASVISLQLSRVRLGTASVADIVGSVPQHLQRLNVSFTGLRFEWDMLHSAPPSLVVLDLSGLSPRRLSSPTTTTAANTSAEGVKEDNADADAAAPPPLSAVCAGGFSPTEIYLSHCGITGALPDLRDCDRLQVLEVGFNRLSRLDLAQLPAGLEVLHLNNNAFAAEMNVSQLPRRLRSLDISSNRFVGTLRLADLPSQLAYFDVSNNTFSGQVNLTQLPESMRFVYLQHNNFSGEADLVDIPLCIRFIMIHHNNWDYRLPAS